MTLNFRGRRGGAFVAALGWAAGMLLALPGAIYADDDPDPFFVEVHVARPADGSTVEYGPLPLDFSVVPNRQDTVDRCQILDGQYPFDDYPHVGLTVWSDENCDPDSPPTVPTLPAGRYTLIIQTDVPEHVNPGILTKFSVAPPIVATPPAVVVPAPPPAGGKPDDSESHEKRHVEKKQKCKSTKVTSAAHLFHPTVLAEGGGLAVPFREKVIATAKDRCGHGNLTGKVQFGTSSINAHPGMTVHGLAKYRTSRVRSWTLAPLRLQEQITGPTPPGASKTLEYVIGDKDSHVDLSSTERITDIKVDSYLELEGQVSIPMDHIQCSFVSGKCTY